MRSGGGGAQLIKRRKLEKRLLFCEFLLPNIEIFPLGKGLYKVMCLL